MSNTKRASGVLMHVSSLYGDYSIGSFGKEALEFIDFLSESGFTYWQVLPFCMTDDCNSPYKSYSAFGANPYFIDLPTLREKGLLTDAELFSAKQRSPYLCEYDRLDSSRLDLLKKASLRVSEDEKRAVLDFVNSNSDYEAVCRFLALKEANNDAPWQEFTTDSYSEETLFMWQFIQYEFFHWVKNSY